MYLQAVADTSRAFASSAASWIDTPCKMQADSSTGNTGFQPKTFRRSMLRWLEKSKLWRRFLQRPSLVEAKALGAHEGAEVGAQRLGVLPCLVLRPAVDSGAAPALG